ALSLALYQNQTLKLFKAEGLVSQYDETEGDFRVRVATSMREARDKVRAAFQQKIAALDEKMKKASDKLEDKKQKSWAGKIQTGISFVTTVLGALMGKRGLSKDTISKTGTALRRAGQISRDSDNVNRAEDSFEAIQQQRDVLQKQMEAETVDVDPAHIALETIDIRPRKSDIVVEKVALLWWPT
ncbi:MAG: ATP-binding protein, partial [Verrucomicrobia bacterium]|nr:ATP-binding protein [Verrucomicrobiota bacterium]